jgi:ABC-type transporter Mla MlaB component
LLKLTFGEEEHQSVLRLEGRLIGPWTSLVERCWRETTERTAKGVTIDLTAVTFVDDGGKMLLAEMHESGAVLRTRGPLMSYIVDQIRKHSTWVKPSTLSLNM